MTDKYYFRTEALSVGYRGRTLIHDIDIGIQKGELVTLIGPNGAGKSTILKSIIRQLAPIAGAVYLEDERVSRISYKEFSRKTAVLLTERVKPELMTCWDIVATGRYPYTGRLGVLTEEDRAIVRKVMEEARIEDFAEKDFGEISDGQKQRVLLARALCQEPELLILDEPTAFLDIRHKLELLELLRGMTREQGITVIMSLHEIDLAQKVSDKILCVKGDKIFRYGAPAEIFNDALIGELYGIENGSYNAAFGSVEMNKPEGEPKTFVISGCGSGISVFRGLQREGVPFEAGILYKNDIDYQIASSLAARVYAEEPFHFIRDDTYAAALNAIRKSEKVLDTGVPIGDCNHRLAELIEEARKRGVYQKLS